MWTPDQVALPLILWSFATLLVGPVFFTLSRWTARARRDVVAERRANTSKPLRWGLATWAELTLDPTLSGVLYALGWAATIGSVLLVAAAVTWGFRAGVFTGA